MPDRQVDVESPAPAEVLDDQGTECRAGGPCHGTDRTPDRNGHRDLVTREGLQHERQRRGHERGRGNRLEDASNDEEGNCRCKTAEHRRNGEQHSGRQKHTPPSDAIRQSPRRDEQRGEHDGVGVQDPRQRRRSGRRELGTDRGEGDEQDRRVEEDGEHGQARAGKYDPRIAISHRIGDCWPHGSPRYRIEIG